MSERFSFSLLGRDGAARRGRIVTPRGVIDTPAFMPVGTAASVKAMMPAQVEATGAQIILANTYHLMLRPGAERIRRLGGLHDFMGWKGPILTDSGGYQVMSLGDLAKVTEAGVAFRSHVDGSAHELSPERAVEIQALLGSDIEMVLDECTPFPATEAAAAASMERSMRWAEQARRTFLARPDSAGRAQFGIVQGGVHADLRRRSLARLEEIGFEGYAVGGLAVGEGQEVMLRVINELTPAMPEAKPRYLMGVGKPDDLIGAVLRGIDMFDCVLPTRSGRHGQAFTWNGAINLKNAEYAEDLSPLDPESSCVASSQFSKAYLHHLVRAGEMLASILLTWHNLSFYQDIMGGLRLAIERREVYRFSSEFMARFRATGENVAL